MKAVVEALETIHNYSIFDKVPFIPEKTDILMVEDYTMGAMENPGLITFKSNSGDDLTTHVHELAHMYFGNLVTLSTWGDIWVNEGFASLYEDNLRPNSSFVSNLNYSLLVSLHELPIHSEKTYTSSIHLDNSFDAQSKVHYPKASEFLRMTRNFVGADVFDRAIKKYLLGNAYGNGDASKIINCLLEEYDGDRAQLQKILYEWIYQPGMAILFVVRNEDGITIRQKRFHSSYFDDKLRDDKTRFTIPLFYSIYGEQHTFVLDSEAESQTIPLDTNSTFVVDDTYGNLFGVWLTPDMLLENDKAPEDWMTLSSFLYLSGHLGEAEFSTAASTVIRTLSKPNERTNNETTEQGETVAADVWTARKIECEEKGTDVLDAPLSKLFMEYLRTNDVHILKCSVEVNDRQKMKEILHQKIISDELKLRNSQLPYLITIMEIYHPGVAMEFALEELQKNPCENSQFRINFLLITFERRSSLPLRLKMHYIIRMVYLRNVDIDISILHEFVRHYPSIVAENYDTILKALERQYVLNEYKNRTIELQEIIKKLVKETPPANP
ncbi:hypothetical protein PMAYCL1PPCAC_30947 [Pristionchus mayeri]|uniref:Peptidase M1 membrane alanine aminopeptidase domain-containing protein n=1 Tax=Pristionchus mayeri TaxID=1317129 RepID=A0AAN5DDW7_9BILA|nr:hypothetical protein PMAYCL1PPCAC_30947 [Pristionchus mayeri]